MTEVLVIRIEIIIIIFSYLKTFTRENISYSFI